MGLLNITSANSSLRCVVPGVFPSGFTFDDYAADSMFSSGALQTKEDLMSADGKYHAGYIFNAAEFTVNLTPSSDSAALLDQWSNIEKATITVLPCNMVLSIPALDTVWNMVNGILYTWAPTPSAGRVLQPRQAVFRFESITKG